MPPILNIHEPSSVWGQSGRQRHGRGAVRRTLKQFFDGSSRLPVENALRSPDLLLFCPGPATPVKIRQAQGPCYDADFAAGWSNSNGALRPLLRGSTDDRNSAAIPTPMRSGSTCASPRSVPRTKHARPRSWPISTTRRACPRRLRGRIPAWGGGLDGSMWLSGPGIRHPGQHPSVVHAVPRAQGPDQAGDRWLRRTRARATPPGRESNSRWPPATPWST